MCREQWSNVQKFLTAIVIGDTYCASLVIPQTNDQMCGIFTSSTLESMHTGVTWFDSKLD